MDVREPPFAKGTLAGFRARLIEHGLDRRLGGRRVEVAARARGSGRGRWAPPRCEARAGRS